MCRPLRESRRSRPTFPPNFCSDCCAEMTLKRRKQKSAAHEEADVTVESITNSEVPSDEEEAEEQSSDEVLDSHGERKVRHPVFSTAARNYAVCHRALSL